MATPKVAKAFIADMQKTIEELSANHLLRDENGIKQGCLSDKGYELSYSGKDETSRIVYDANIPCSCLIEALLKNRQFSILLYDKSIVQAEFLFSGDELIKERLLFIKKHNKIWGKEEIGEFEATQDDDWFSEENGVPIVFRVDFDLAAHQEGIHPAAHFTISNHESCRIPLKAPMTFSEFIRFILSQFYGTKIAEYSSKIAQKETITELERSMLHINWK